MYRNEAVVPVHGVLKLINVHQWFWRKFLVIEMGVFIKESLLAKWGRPGSWANLSLTLCIHDETTAIGRTCLFLRNLSDFLHRFLRSVILTLQIKLWVHVTRLWKTFEFKMLFTIEFFVSANKQKGRWEYILRSVEYMPFTV